MVYEVKTDVKKITHQKRLQEVRLEEKLIAQHQAELYRQFINDRKQMKLQKKREEMKAAMASKCESMVLQMQQSLVHVGDAHRLARAEIAKKQELQYQKELQQERTRIETQKRNQEASKIILEQQCLVLQQRQSTLLNYHSRKEMEKIDRETAHSYGEMKQVQELLHPKRTLSPSSFSTRITQSAEHVHHRFPTTIQATVIRSAPTNTIVNDAEHQENITRRTTWKGIMTELTNKNKIKKRAKEAKIVIKQEKEVRELESELQHLYQIDHHLNQTKRREINYSIDHAANMAKQKSFEKIFMATAYPTMKDTTNLYSSNRSRAIQHEEDQWQQQVQQQQEQQQDEEQQAWLHKQQQQQRSWKQWQPEPPQLPPTTNTLHPQQPQVQQMPPLSAVIPSVYPYAAQEVDTSMETEDEESQMEEDNNITNQWQQQVQQQQEQQQDEEQQAWLHKQQQQQRSWKQWQPEPPQLPPTTNTLHPQQPQVQQTPFTTSLPAPPLSAVIPSVYPYAAQEVDTSMETEDEESQMEEDNNITNSSVVSRDDDEEPREEEIMQKATSIQTHITENFSQNDHQSAKANDVSTTNKIEIDVAVPVIRSSVSPPDNKTSQDDHGSISSYSSTDDSTQLQNKSSNKEISRSWKPLPSLITSAVTRPKSLQAGGSNSSSPVAETEKTMTRNVFPTEEVTLNERLQDDKLPQPSPEKAEMKPIDDNHSLSTGDLNTSSFRSPPQRVASPILSSPSSTSSATDSFSGIIPRVVNEANMSQLNSQQQNGQASSIPTFPVPSVAASYQLLTSDDDDEHPVDGKEDYQRSFSTSSTVSSSLFTPSTVGLPSATSQPSTTVTSSNALTATTTVTSNSTTGEVKKTNNRFAHQLTSHILQEISLDLENDSEEEDAYRAYSTTNSNVRTASTTTLSSSLHYQQQHQQLSASERFLSEHRSPTSSDSSDDNMRIRSRHIVNDEVLVDEDQSRSSIQSSSDSSINLQSLLSDSSSYLLTSSPSRRGRVTDTTPSLPHQTSSIATTTLSSGDRLMSTRTMQSSATHSLYTTSGSYNYSSRLGTSSTTANTLATFTPSTPPSASSTPSKSYNSSPDSASSLSVDVSRGHMMTGQAILKSVTNTSLLTPSRSSGNGSGSSSGSSRSIHPPSTPSPADSTATPTSRESKHSSSSGGSSNSSRSISDILRSRGFDFSPTVSPIASPQLSSIATTTNTTTNHTQSTTISSPSATIIIPTAPTISAASNDALPRTFSSTLPNDATFQEIQNEIDSIRKRLLSTVSVSSTSSVSRSPPSNTGSGSSSAIPSPEEPIASTIQSGTSSSTSHAVDYLLSPSYNHTTTTTKTMNTVTTSTIPSSSNNQRLLDSLIFSSEEEDDDDDDEFNEDDPVDRYLLHQQQTRQQTATAMSTMQTNIVSSRTVISTSSRSSAGNSSANTSSTSGNSSNDISRRGEMVPNSLTTGSLLSLHSNEQLSTSSTSTASAHAVPMSNITTTTIPVSSSTKPNTNTTVTTPSLSGYSLATPSSIITPSITAHTMMTASTSSVMHQEDDHHHGLLQLQSLRSSMDWSPSSSSSGSLSGSLSGSVSGSQSTIDHLLSSTASAAAGALVSHPLSVGNGNTNGNGNGDSNSISGGTVGSSTMSMYSISHTAPSQQYAATTTTTTITTSAAPMNPNRHQQQPSPPSFLSTSFTSFLSTTDSTTTPTNTPYQQQQAEHTLTSQLTEEDDDEHDESLREASSMLLVDDEGEDIQDMLSHHPLPLRVAGATTLHTPSSVYAHANTMIATTTSSSTAAAAVGLEGAQAFYLQASSAYSPTSSQSSFSSAGEIEERRSERLMRMLRGSSGSRSLSSGSSISMHSHSPSVSVSPSAADEEEEEDISIESLKKRMQDLSSYSLL